MGNTGCSCCRDSCSRRLGACSLGRPLLQLLQLLGCSAYGGLLGGELCEELRYGEPVEGGREGNRRVDRVAKGGVGQEGCTGRGRGGGLNNILINIFFNQQSRNH